MTRGAFFEKRTWYFQNFCSCLPNSPAPQRLHHRSNQLPSPGRTLQIPLPIQPSDTLVTVQAGCMAPGRPSMPWVRSACPVCAMSVPGHFLPWAGPQEVGVTQRSHVPQLPPPGLTDAHSPVFSQAPGGCGPISLVQLCPTWRGGVGSASLPSLCQVSAGEKEGLAPP